MDLRAVYTEIVQVVFGSEEIKENPNQRMHSLIREVVSNLEWDCGKRVQDLTKLEASGFLGKLSRTLDEVSDGLEWSIEKRVLDLENNKIKECLESICVDRAKSFLFDLTGHNLPVRAHAAQACAI